MSADYYMKLALKQAEIAMKIGEVPIGAVVVKNDTVIALAHNMRETENQTASHAEMLAIKEACKNLNNWRLDNCDIFVTLEPCPMCAGAIIQARIRNVYYGCFDKKAGSFGTVADISAYRWTNSPNIYAGIMEDECSFLIKKFFAQIRDSNK